MNYNDLLKLKEIKIDYLTFVKFDLCAFETFIPHVGYIHIVFNETYGDIKIRAYECDPPTEHFDGNYGFKYNEDGSINISNIENTLKIVFQLLKDFYNTKIQHRQNQITQLQKGLASINFMEEKLNEL